MTRRSILTVPHIQPTSARSLIEYSLLCTCGAIWNAFDLFHILQWTYWHGMMTQVDSRSFCMSLHIVSQWAPDLLPVPVLVIVVRILSRFLFWAGSGLILAAYSSKMDRYGDGFRLVGFLWFTTIGLDIATTMLATGQGHLFFANSFGTVRETLTTLILLSVLAFALFPRRLVKP